jgi:diguanylate cyclase (GGDEF)-like protein
MVLRRTAQELEANPLTKLPGNTAILLELETRIAEHRPLAVAYVDLDRFKAFNDHYGFHRGDEVIRRTAGILLAASKAEGNEDDFVGHIGGDDFVLVTTPDRADAVCNMVVREFDAMAGGLYDDRERSQGFITHTDRKGQTLKIPLLSVSIALVTNEYHAITHPGQVAALSAELKEYAKQFERSLYVKERRRDT